jgi:hypothetical protein
MPNCGGENIKNIFTHGACFSRLIEGVKMTVKYMEEGGEKLKIFLHTEPVFCILIKGVKK